MVSFNPIDSSMGSQYHGGMDKGKDESVSQRIPRCACRSRWKVDGRGRISCGIGIVSSER